MKTKSTKKVLEGIADLSYQTSGECTFGGSVVACMKYISDPTSYDFVMGVSGGAFKLMWHRQWCPSNNSLGILGHQPVRRAFRALGYEHEVIDKGKGQDDQALFRRKIRESLDNDRPVIAWGVVGPPDECIVAGYEQDGDVLLGRSYFHDGSNGYYRKTDWYKDCCGLILIGKKQPAPTRRQILRDALQWAVQLAATADSSELPGVPGADSDRVTGLAAYDAWAQAIQRDEDFPEGDVKTLTFRCQVNKSVTLSGLCDARRAAVAFLTSMADADPAATSSILAATEAYQGELNILDQAMKLTAFCYDSQDKRLQMADVKLRRRLAEIILQAKQKDQLAIEHLAQAMQAMGR